MNRKSRRFTIFIVLVCMLTTAMPTFAVDSTTEIDNSNATLFFSSNDGIGTSSALNYVKGEAGRPKAIAVKGGQTAYFYASEIKESDADIISFDFKVPDNGTFGYFELFDPVIDSGESHFEKFKRIFFLREKNMGTFDKYNGASIASSSSVTQTPGKWQHVDMCVNYKTKTVKVFLDGKVNGSIALPEDYPLCGGIRLVLERGTADIPCVLDNITMYHIEKTGKPFVLPEGITYPEEWLAFAKIESKTLGSVYFTQTPEFDLVIENVYDKKNTYNIEINVYDDDKIHESTSVQEVELEASETRTIPINVQTKHYGFHYMEITLTDSVSKQSVVAEKTFSTVMKSDKPNPKAGINDHTDSLHAVDQVVPRMQMFKNAGFAFFRSDWNWRNVELGKGVFSPRNGLVPYNNAIEETGMGNYLIATGYNEPICGEKGYSKPSSIKHFGDYTAWLAGLTKNQNIQFEIWNEFNHAPFNPAGDTIETYIKLQTEAYKRIKAVNPKAKVFGMGGVTYISNLYDWVEEYFELGGGENCDGFAFHPYTPSGTAETAYGVFNKVNEIVEKHGYGDKPLSLSEMGWTKPVAQEETQMDYIAQFALLTYDEVDNYVWYVNQMKQTTSISENEFGWIRAWDEAYAAPFEPHSARPVFIAIAAQNNILNGADHKEFIEFEDKDIRAVMYDLPDGNKIIGAWTISGTKKDITINVGTNTVDFYDPYGNKTALGTMNGKVTLPIGSTPIYIKGSFSKATEAKGVSTSISNKGITTTASDTFSVYVTKYFDGNASIEVDVPKNITLTENKGFNGKIAALKFEAGSEPVEKSSIKIRIKTGESVVNEYELPIDYIDTVTAGVHASYFRSYRWQYNISLKNNKVNEKVSGKVVMESAAGNAEMKFKDITPGNTKNIYINIPENLVDVKAPFKGKVILDSGEEYLLESDVYLSSIVYTEKKPEIDGNVDDDEWFKEADFKLKYQSQIYMLDDSTWAGPTDVGGKVYAMYDKENFYIAAEITDDIMGSTGAAAWENDSLQFAFAPTKAEKSAIRTEYGIGMANGEKLIERYSFVTVDTGILGVTDKGDTTGIIYDIKRDEEKKMTYYEIQVPWEQIYGPDFNVAKQNILYFSMLINDNDGSGRRGWIEFCPGIGAKKDPSQFIDVPLMKRSKMSFIR